jgi:hypothetical protein
VSGLGIDKYREEVIVYSKKGLLGWIKGFEEVALYIKVKYT